MQKENTETISCYYSQKSDDFGGHCIYLMTDGTEVKVTSVGDKTLWDDEIYVGETPGLDCCIVGKSNKKRSYTWDI